MRRSMQIMNTKNENFTPRERVDAQLLQRLLRENDSPASVPVQARVQPRPAARNRRTAEEQCSCGTPRTTEKSGDRCPSAGRSLAMVYSPIQKFEDLFDAEEGLCRGTIFRQLDLPLTVGRCQEGRWKA